MGCCPSAKSEVNDNIGTCILKCDVSKINRIPDEEMDKFKKEHFCDSYLLKEEEGYNERIGKSCELMFCRWEWMNKNKETYVNMLRCKNFKDEAIQACLDGKRPLSFQTEELHEEFCTDLKELGKKLEEETCLKFVWFVQTGSAVPGFSSNPLKGFPDRPSKITDPEKSDVDIVIIGHGVKEFIEEKKKEGVKIKEYPCVCTKEGGVDVRYSTKNLTDLSGAVNEWAEKWGKKLGGGVQVTFQDGNPTFPPWELAVPIKK